MSRLLIEATTPEDLMAVLGQHRPDAVADYDGRELAAVDLVTDHNGRLVARLRFQRRRDTRRRDS